MAVLRVARAAAPGECLMALDRSGGYLLAAFQVQAGAGREPVPALRIARVAVSTGRVAILRIRPPGPLAITSIAR